MEKAGILKVLSVISSLYTLGEIDIKKKNKLLSFVKDGNEGAINKELFRIREYSSCRNLIDEYLEGSEKGGRLCKE